MPEKFKSFFVEIFLFKIFPTLTGLVSFLVLSNFLWALLISALVKFLLYFFDVEIRKIAYWSRRKAVKKLEQKQKCMKKMKQSWFRRNYLGVFTGKKFLVWIFSIFLIIALYHIIFRIGIWS